MARRVNTKFVVILSAALVGTVGIFGGVKYYRWSQAHDPAAVLEKGEAAFKAGDLKQAVMNFSNAAQLMSVKHVPGADGLFARSADLCMKISREAANQEDAVRYYQLAMDNYNRALTENPQNKAVNETLMEEDYQNAQYFSSTSSWKALEEVTGKMIKTQDGVKPRLYRAEARLNLLQGTLLQSTFQSNTSASFTLIEADLDAAQKFEPHSEEAVALRAEDLWLKARLSASRRGLTKPEDFNSDERYMRDVAAIRHMLVRCLQGKWGRQQNTPGWTWLVRIPLDHVNADVANTLVTLTLEQYDLSGRKDASRLDAATSLLQMAVAADARLVDRLGALYMATGHSDKAEELFKKQTNENKSEDPEAYFRLANFYRNQGGLKYPEAIKSYQDVTKHTLIGSGRDAIRNAQYQLQAVEGIAWLSMELAEHPPVKSDHPTVEILDFDGYMKQMAAATDKLRITHAPRGMIELLDGRALLIARDIPRAVTTLRAAEADLSTVAWLNERYRQTELMLARANEMQNQLGAALDLVNKALEIKPGDPLVTLQKGRYLLALAQYEEARRLMGKLLGETTDQKFANEKYMTKEFADAAKTIWQTANSRLPDSKATTQMDLPANSLQMAQLEMENNDFEGALNDLQAVLKKADTNSASENSLAYRFVIECNLQLKHMDEARKYADEAFAKFPDNAMFQVAKAQMHQAGAPDSFETQKAIIDAITDPYLHAVNLAAIYHRKALANNRPGYSPTPAEIKASLQDLTTEFDLLKSARDLLKSATSPDDRAKLGNLLDRQFTALMTQANQAADPGARKGYFDNAQSIVTDLEKLNLDGTDGKLYRGRLELSRTDGKNGMQFLQQAVAQRPDLAQAHLVLGQGYLSQAINRNNGSTASTSNLNSALDEFRQVIRLAPNNIMALQLAIRLLVQKGDSSSLKEAETLLQSGLALAPRNSTLISYTEIFPSKVDDAVKMRERIQQEQPDDRDNIRRLASLYVRVKDKQLESAREFAKNTDSLDKAREAIQNAANAMDRAIALMEADYKNHLNDKDAMYTAQFLAQLLVEYDGRPVLTADMTREQVDAAKMAAIKRSADQAQEAFGLYEKYINEATSSRSRFDVLIAKAEFLRKLTLRPQAIALLISTHSIGDKDLWEKAAGDKFDVSDAPKIAAVEALNAAIRLEPEMDAANAAEAARKGEPAPPLTDDAERHLADMYFDMGNMADAERTYEQVLAKKATSEIDRVTRRLIEVRLRLKKYTQADAQLADLLKAQPQDAQGLILRAFSSMQQGLGKPAQEQQTFLKAALTDLNSVLARDPANVDALYYRATAQISLGDRLEDAEKDLIKAANLDASKINSQLVLAELYVRMQRYSDASREFEEILKLHPEMLNIRVEYTDLLKGLAELQATLGTGETDFEKSLRQLGPLEKLMDQAKAGQDLYPNEVHWPFLYAQALALQGKPAEAHRYFASLFAARPEAPICDAYLGSLLIQKDYANAVKIGDDIIAAAIKFNPDTKTTFMAENPQYVSFYLKQAAAYLALGNAEQANKDIDSALEIGATAADKSKTLGPFIAVLNEAVSKGGAGQPEPIIKPELLAERLRHRVDAHPAETITRMGLIQTLLLMNQNDEALKIMKDLVVPGDGDPTLRFLAISQTALVRQQNKRYPEAEKDYQELMKISPDNEGVLNNYAFMLAEMGRAKEAIELANRALTLLSTRADPGQLSTGSANVYDTLGWAYYQNNDFLNAETNLRKSVKIQPQAAAYLHLALTLYKKNDNDEALVNCQTGMNLAKARNDTETLAKLKDLQLKLDPKAARP